MSPNACDLTQDSFVDGTVIYASSRMSKAGKAMPGLFKSADNGRTWQFVNYMDPDVDWNRTADCESGIERVGESEIAAVIRGTLQGCALPWITRSNDLGKTWEKLVRADDRVCCWKRPRIYTYNHLRQMSGAETIPKWWNDSLLLGTGVIQVSAKPPRRNIGLWYSTDKGGTWSTPLKLDKDTEDAGYGDLRMRKNGEFVIVSYHGSFKQAVIKQYVIHIDISK